MCTISLTNSSPLPPQDATHQSALPTSSSRPQAHSPLHSAIPGLLPPLWTFHSPSSSRSHPLRLKSLHHQRRRWERQPLWLWHASRRCRCLLYSLSPLSLASSTPFSSLWFLPQRHQGPPVWSVPLNTLDARFPFALPRPCTFLCVLAIFSATPDRFVCILFFLLRSFFVFDTRLSVP